MSAVSEPKVERISVEMELANDEDLMRAEAGIITADQVRRVRIRAVVDTMAMRMVIPETVAKQLGLEVSGITTVHYADGRSAERSIVQRIHLSLAGRESIFNAIVEPGRKLALIGAIVMEDLDLLVDCVGQRVIPRDPKQIISEVE